MSLEIDPYIAVHFLRVVDTIPLSNAHAKESELKLPMIEYFQEWARKNGVEDICDAPRLATELFQSLVETGKIATEDHAFGVKYYLYNNNKYNQYREKVLNESAISKMADSVKGRYFPDIYEAYRQQFGAVGEDITIPAADRFVTLNHNHSEYIDIATGLFQLEEQVRGANDLPPEERDRLRKSLAAAKTLWSAQELRAIQVKVGVLMAIEDTGSAFKSIGKAIAVNLLLDAIKSYLKNYFEIDLDQI